MGPAWAGRCASGTACWRRRWPSAATGTARRYGCARSPDAGRSDSSDPPGRQFELLAGKYRDREPGRIPLPLTSHELWAQHKYSVLARSQAVYRDLGRRVARLRGRDGFDEVALELTTLLREAPDPGNLRNAVQHLWGLLRLQHVEGVRRARVAPQDLRHRAAPLPERASALSAGANSAD